jgi:DNA polymerase III subunit delta'
MSDMDLPETHDSLPGYPAPAAAETVLGHEAHEENLAKAYRAGKLHHALIFNGPQGIGKATFAFKFARHIIENPEPKSAPERFDATADFGLLRQIASGAHPQVLHLTRPLDIKTGKFKTQLTIDETKRIGRFLTRTVAGNGHRVVIVDPVNDMNASAANALLKNLEEPTPRTVFMLISHAAGRLLPTIRSRCLLMPFQPLDDNTMRKVLTGLGIADRVQGADFGTLLSMAEGSPRLAAMLADGGGLEIISTAETVLTQKTFDFTAASKIGEALGGRDSDMLFALFVDQMMKQLADRARMAALDSQMHARRLADWHQLLTTKISGSLEYNLDRKQLVWSLLRQLHNAAQGGSAG